MNPEFLISLVQPFVAYGTKIETEAQAAAVKAKTKKVILVSAIFGIAGVLAGLGYAQGKNRVGYAIGGFLTGAAIGALAGKFIITAK